MRLPDRPVLHWRDLQTAGIGDSAARMRALRLSRTGRLCPVGGQSGYYINTDCAPEGPLWAAVLAAVIPRALIAGETALAIAKWLASPPADPIILLPPQTRAVPPGFTVWRRSGAEFAALAQTAIDFHGTRCLPPSVALADLLRHAPRRVNTLRLSLPDDLDLDQIRRAALTPAVV